MGQSERLGNELLIAVATATEAWVEESKLRIVSP